MANYATLKAAIADVIKTNGNEEITGEIMQNVLIAIIEALGVGFQFMGVATPDTNPGTPDQKQFYIASSGVYPNFGVSIEDGYIGFIINSDGWELQTIEINSTIVGFWRNVLEQGLYFCDSNGNISISINNMGLGFAKITPSTIAYLNSVLNTGGGGESGFVDVEEDGLYIVDSVGNIAMMINNNGFRAFNLDNQFEFELVSDVEYNINI